jgi:hypothetical protein
MKKMHAFKLAGTAMFILSAASSAMAADGFKLRFPISGTLGGEIVAPLPSEGWVGSMALTDVNVDKVAGSDGNALVLTGPQSKDFVTPYGTKSSTFTSSALLDYKQRQTQANMTFARLLSSDVQGGKLALAINIPYLLSLNTDAKFSGATPTLGTLSPAITVLPPPNNGPAYVAGANAQLQAGTQAAFGPGYQAGLISQGQTASVNTSGLGDIETSLLWEKTVDQFKIVGGATLALPTGNYSYVAGTMKPNIGYGKYYTFRPGVGVAYTASENVTLGARGSLGFNTQNTENKVRSGDFYVIDLAAAFKTPVGVFGPHMTIMRQYTDDTGGNVALGANRLSLTGAGAFATFPIASIGAGLNLSYMKTIDARNSLAGSFIQARLSKAF